MPINKNLWTTSYGLVTAGGGLVGLGVTYVLVDVLKLWSGMSLPYIDVLNHYVSRPLCMQGTLLLVWV